MVPEMDTLKHPAINMKKAFDKVMAQTRLVAVGADGVGTLPKSCLLCGIRLEFGILGALVIVQLLAARKGFEWA